MGSGNQIPGGVSSGHMKLAGSTVPVTPSSDMDGGWVKPKKSSDARLNFRTFWKILDEKYAAFPTRLPEGKTWEQIREEYGASLSDKSTDKELLKAIRGAVRELNDAHTGIDTGDKDIDGWKEGYEYEKQMRRLSRNVARRYATSKMKWLGDGNIGYTRIGDTGYINLDTMSDFASPSNEEIDIRIARESMRKILSKFERAGVSSLVIDVRNNEGGFDSVGLEIARFLKGPRSLAWNKQIRNGPHHDDLSPPVPTFVEASYDEAFQGPVAILTSGATLSAGETFVMAMRDRERTVLIGEPTSGHFSDEHYAKLPNGWTLIYSGERYTDEKGIDYEVKGFPPDIAVAFDPKKFSEGTDIMLERALKELRRPEGALRRRKD